MSRFYKTSGVARYQLPVNLMSKVLQGKQQEYDQFQQQMDKSLETVYGMDAVYKHHKQYLDQVKNKLDKKTEEWSNKDLSQPEVQDEIKDEIREISRDPNLSNIQKSTQDYKDEMDRKESQIENQKFSEANFYPNLKKISTAQQLSLDDTGGKAKRIKLQTTHPYEDYTSKFNTMFKAAEDHITKKRINGLDPIGQKMGLKPNQEANIKVTSLSKDELSSKASEILNRQEERQVQQEFQYLKEVSGELPQYTALNEEGEKETRTVDDWGEFAMVQSMGIADMYDKRDMQISDVTDRETELENENENETSTDSETPDERIVGFGKSKDIVSNAIWNPEKNTFKDRSEFEKQGQRVTKIAEDKNNLTKHLTEKVYNERKMRENFPGMNQKDVNALKETGAIKYGYGTSGETTVPEVNITKEDIAKNRLRAEGINNPTEEQINEKQQELDISDETLESFQQDVTQKLKNYKKQQQLYKQYQDYTEKEFKKSLSSKEEAVYEDKKDSPEYEEAKKDAYLNILGNTVGYKNQEFPDETELLYAKFTPKNVNQENEEDYKKLLNLAFDKQPGAMDDLLGKWREEGIIESYEDLPSKMKNPSYLFSESLKRTSENTASFIKKSLGDAASVIFKRQMPNLYELNREKFKKNYDKIKPLLEGIYKGIDILKSNNLDIEDPTVFTNPEVKKSVSFDKGAEEVLPELYNLKQEDVESRKESFKKDSYEWLKENNVKSEPVFRYSPPTQAGTDLVTGDALTKTQIHDTDVYSFENNQLRQYGTKSEKDVEFHGALVGTSEHDAHFARDHNKFNNIKNLTLLQNSDDVIYNAAGEKADLEIGEKYSPEDIILDKKQVTNNYTTTGNAATGLHYKGFKVDQKTGEIKGVFNLVKSNGQLGPMVEAEFGGDTFSKQFHDSVGNIDNPERTLQQINTGLNFAKVKGTENARRKIFNGKLALFPKVEEGDFTHKDINIVKRSSASGNSKFAYKADYDLSDEEYENIVSSLKNSWNENNPTLNVQGKEVQWNQLDEDMKSQFMPSKEDLDISDQTFNTKLELAKSLQQIDNYFRTALPEDTNKSYEQDVTAAYNNPLALRFNDHQQGAVEGERGKTDNAAGFAKFDDLKMGWEAGKSQLSLYQFGQSNNVDGIPSVKEFVSVYAPEHENDVDRYVKKLIDYINPKIDEKIDEDTALSEIDNDILAEAVASIESSESFEKLKQEGIIQ